MVVGMSEERRTSRFLPFRLALASAGFVGLLAGGSIGVDTISVDHAKPDSSGGVPLVAAGAGPADAVSSGS